MLKMRWQNPWRCPTVRSGAGSCYSCFAVSPETGQSLGCFAAYTGTGTSSWTLPQADLKQNHPLAGPQPELAQEDYINFPTGFQETEHHSATPQPDLEQHDPPAVPQPDQKQNDYLTTPNPDLMQDRKIHQLTHSLTWCMIIFQLLHLEVVKWVTRLKYSRYWSNTTQPSSYSVIIFSMVIGVIFMLRSTPNASTDSDFERWVSLHQFILSTNWKIVIQEVRLWYNWRISLHPVSLWDQPVGWLEELPALGQHVRQLKDGTVSGQVVRSSAGSSCVRSGCGPAEGSFCFRLGCGPS